MIKYDKSELEDLIVNKGLSYESIGKLYGCTGSNIKKVAQRLGIQLKAKRNVNPLETFNKGKGVKIFCKYCNADISHKHGNQYCDTKCQIAYSSKIKWEHFLTNPIEFQRANFSVGRWVKRNILMEQSNLCSICNSPTTHNGKPLVFVLDHIDCNAANNTRQNLRAVCPNCDSQLDTFKSKNKNSARNYYRYPKPIEE